MFALRKVVLAPLFSLAFTLLMTSTLAAYFVISLNAPLTCEAYTNINASYCTPQSTFFENNTAHYFHLEQSNYPSHWDSHNTQCSTFEPRKIRPSFDILAVCARLTSTPGNQSYISSKFENLPAKLRNVAYNYVFLPNTKFETSQRMSDPVHEKPPTYTEADALRVHPVMVDGVKIQYLLGILGTC